MAFENALPAIYSIQSNIEERTLGEPRSGRVLRISNVLLVIIHNDSNHDSHCNTESGISQVGSRIEYLEQALEITRVRIHVHFAVLKDQLNSIWLHRS